MAQIAFPIPEAPARRVSFSKGPSRPAPLPDAPTPTTVDAPAGAFSAASDEAARALCRAIAAGDGEALTLLYSSWANRAFALAGTLVGPDEATRLDVVQEAFLRLIRAPGQLVRVHDHEHLERWMLRLVHSAALDHLRRERRRVRRESAHAAGRAAAEVRDDRIESLRREIDRMEVEDRAWLTLRFGDASHAPTLSQLARVFETTIGAAHGRVRRAMNRLSDRL